MPHVTSSDGTRIAYDRRGAGPALILVHGATQFRAVDDGFQDLADRLADRVSVLRFDRRGRGGSGDAAAYAPAREVEDLGALIEAAGGRAALLGHSSGGVLALEAAAAMPGKVSALVLYEPPLDPSRPAEAAQAEAEAMDDLARQGERARMLERFLRGVGMPEDALAGFRQSPAWAPFESAALALAHDFRVLAGAAGATPPDRWRAAAMPTLVVTGSETYGFMGPAADWLAAALPDARRLTLPGQGHAFDPAAFAPVVADFLAASILEPST